MNLKKYYWGLNEKALKETGKILRDPSHPQFRQRMFTLLSRCDRPKEVFSVISKDHFVKIWPEVRKYWARTSEAQDFRAWWETVYEQISKSHMRPKGRPLEEFQNIGAIIRDARLEKGWSQSELSERVDIRQPDISAIESGRKNMTLETLIRLFKALDIKKLSL